MNLANQEDARQYLSAALEESPEMVLIALGDIAEANRKGKDMYYPSMRYAVINGELKSEKIDCEEQEREGWLESPHRFRVITYDEFLREGYEPEDAARLHQRDVRRVAHIFAGKSLEEAEQLADAEGPGIPVGPPATPARQVFPPPAVVETKIAELQAQVVKLTTDNEDLRAAADIADNTVTTMKESFEKAYAALKAQRDELQAKLDAMSSDSKPQDAESDGEEPKSKRSKK